MDNEDKKRGRPSLSNEEKENHRIARNGTANIRHKAQGYSAQKRYRNNHPEKYDYYEPKLRILKEYKLTLDELLTNTGLSITKLCLTALEEKYNVILQKHIDNDDTL